MISRRVSDPTLISPQRIDDNYTVWHYRILTPEPHPENRSIFFANKGVYNIWGYTTQPTAHIIGLIEFSEPVSKEHVKRVIRHQYNGAILMEPLNKVVQCARTMAYIRDTRHVDGGWAETHNEDSSDSDSESGDYERGEYEPPDEQHFPSHPEEPNPNEVPYDPMDSIADIGERILAHI
jgi:hypothetical protein